MGRPNPSFLKRQKEQKRKEKAEQKRAVRQSRGVNPRQPEDWNVPMGPEGPLSADAPTEETDDGAPPSED